MNGSKEERIWFNFVLCIGIRMRAWIACKCAWACASYISPEFARQTNDASRWWLQTRFDFYWDFKVVLSIPLYFLRSDNACHRIYIGRILLSLKGNEGIVPTITPATWLTLFTYYLQCIYLITLLNVYHVFERINIVINSEIFILKINNFVVSVC